MLSFFCNKTFSKEGVSQLHKFISWAVFFFFQSNPRTGISPKSISTSPNKLLTQIFLQMPCYHFKLNVFRITNIIFFLFKICSFYIFNLSWAPQCPGSHSNLPGIQIFKCITNWSSFTFSNLLSSHILAKQYSFLLLF